MYYHVDKDIILPYFNIKGSDCLFGFKDSRSKDSGVIIGLQSESDLKDTGKNQNVLSLNNMYIPENCLVIGTIESKGDVRIAGKIEGEIIVSGKLDIAQSALITGNIQADSLLINGELHGNINVKNLLEVGPTGRLFGDIVANFLKIVRGAHFVGTSTHHDESSLSTNKINASSHSSLLQSIMAKNSRAI
ncbi:MAG: hypothetical protein APF84_07155 [Gracilibacter sp. BRH_c7a]|nr:MAG: hypothetical protein APF84_07155 [Gracilibacter sp. BRH_c7a]